MVSTLIADTNAGSMRWFYGLEDMPLSMSMIKSGNIDDYILPDEGFTVEEAAAREDMQDESTLETNERTDRGRIRTSQGYLERTSRI